MEKRRLPRGREVVRNVDRYDDDDDDETVLTEDGALLNGELAGDVGRAANSKSERTASASPVLFHPPLFGSMKGQTGHVR